MYVLREVPACRIQGRGNQPFMFTEAGRIYNLQARQLEMLSCYFVCTSGLPTLVLYHLKVHITPPEANKRFTTLSTEVREAGPVLRQLKKSYISYSAGNCAHIGILCTKIIFVVHDRDRVTIN